MSAISDIDISYSDIGTKYVGLHVNPLIAISEEFRYWHQLPFRYRTKSLLDIPISKIDQSFPNDPCKILLIIILSHWFWTHSLHVKYLLSYHCATKVCKFWCQISDMRQKFILMSDLMLDSAHFSPISDIPISGSVRYRWSPISDWVPTYGRKAPSTMSWRLRPTAGLLSSAATISSSYCTAARATGPTCFAV
jgi:hypothetical protein